MTTEKEIIEVLLDEAGKARTSEHFDEICRRIEKMRSLQDSNE